MASAVAEPLVCSPDVSDAAIHRIRMQTTGENVAVVASTTGKVGGSLLLPLECSAVIEYVKMGNGQTLPRTKFTPGRNPTP